MMPACPSPAPDPFRAPRQRPPAPMPLLWLGSRSVDAVVPPIGKYGLN